MPRPGDERAASATPFSIVTMPAIWCSVDRRRTVIVKPERDQCERRPLGVARRETERRHRGLARASASVMPTASRTSGDAPWGSGRLSVVRRTVR